MPSPGAETTAFQPIRPGKVPSCSSTRCGSSTAARSGSSSRVVFRPPAPAGKLSFGAPAGHERDAPAVDHQHEPPLDLLALAPQHLGTAEAVLLDGGDLGLVEDVADADVVVRDADACSGG